MPDCWEVSSVDSIVQNFREKLEATNYRPVDLLSVLSEIFEKFVNEMHIEKSV